MNATRLAIAVSTLFLVHDLAAEEPAPRPALPAGAVARLADDRLRHADRPTTLLFLPDGKRLIAGSQDGVVRSWDVATGTLNQELVRVGMSVASIDFVTGGQLAVSFGLTNLQFLDSETLKQTSTLLLPQHEQAAVSSDNKYVAFVTNTQEVRLLERENGLPMLDLPTGRRVAFRPDNKAVAVGEVDGNVSLFQIAGGKPLLKVRHGAVVSALAFRRDGAVLVTADNGDKPRVKAWQVGREKPLVELEASGPIAFVGNNRLAVARGDRISIWDFVREKWALDISAKADVLAVSPDGSILASASAGQRIQLWDLASGQSRIPAQSTLPEARLLLPSAQGREVFAVGKSTALRWQVARMESASHELEGLPIVAAASAPGRLALASESGIRMIEDFDPSLAREWKTKRLTEAAPGVRAMSLSADGKLLALGGSDSKIALLNPANGQSRGVVPATTTTLALALHPAGDRLAVLGRDGFLRLWSLPADVEKNQDRAPKELWKLRVQRSPRGTVAFSPDGSLVASTSATRLTLVNTATGQDHYYLDKNGDDGAFFDLAFSSDGRCLASTSAGTAGAVHLWELATRSLVKRFTTGQGDSTRVAFSKDGRRLFSTGEDESITAWDATDREGLPKPTDDDLKAALMSLDSLDAAKASAGVWALAEGGKRSLPLLDQILAEIGTKRARVKALISQLDSDDFAVREKASGELQALSFWALAEVEAAAESAVSKEVRQRATKVREALGRHGIHLPAHGLVAGDLQAVRAVEVLEKIGGPEARGRLQALAKRGGMIGPAVSRP